MYRKEIQCWKFFLFRLVHCYTNTMSNLQSTIPIHCFCPTIAILSLFSFKNHELFPWELFELKLFWFFFYNLMLLHGTLEVWITQYKLSDYFSLTKLPITEKYWFYYSIFFSTLLQWYRKKWFNKITCSLQVLEPNVF